MNGHFRCLKEEIADLPMNIKFQLISKHVTEAHEPHMEDEVLCEDAQG